MPKPEFEEHDLKISGDGIWVHAGPLSLYVTRTDEGVVYDMYAKAAGEDDPMEIIDSGYSFFNEAEMSNES